MDHNKIESILFNMQDLEYKKFNSMLIPTIDKDTIIGVKTPNLRKLANQLNNDPKKDIFLNTLPHKYHEENNLHSFIIAKIKNFEECIDELNKFLPYVNNWATCDSIRPICFKNNKDKLLPQIENWISSTHIYTIRFGIEMMMVHFLDDKFDRKHLDTISNITSEEYYVNMMIAWYFATALAKQYDDSILYLQQNQLSVWVHNKTIQKAIESYRITNSQKKYLRSLKRKNI